MKSKCKSKSFYFKSMSGRNGLQSESRLEFHKTKSKQLVHSTHPNTAFRKYNVFRNVITSQVRQCTFTCCHEYGRSKRLTMWRNITYSKLQINGHMLTRVVISLRATAYMLSSHMLSQFRPSVCPSATRVDQSKTVEVRIMQFSPHSSPIPLVFIR